MIQVFHDPGYAAPLGDHIMPMKKFDLVSEALKVLPYVQMSRPSPIGEMDLLRVHSPQYVEAIRAGLPKDLAESQKFPWSPDLYPSVLLTNGGLLAAARVALKDGFSANLASGFHHAHEKRGEGFCTFNGLVVTLEALRENSLIKRAGILDLDLHYGNGTALLARSRPWIKCLSIYGNDYWDNVSYRDVSMRKHGDGENHWSIPLPEGCDRKTLLGVLEANLPKLLDPEKLDLLLYQAGADPYYEDPYSPLSLDHEDLYQRDRMVFEFAKKTKTPIAWVLAGGYTPDISKVVQVHVNTFRAWKDVFLA